MADTPKASSKSGSFLSKKIGPVPMPIVIVVGGGLVYYAYTRYKSGSSATGSTAATSATPGTAGEDTSGYGGYDSGGGGSSGGGSSGGGGGGSGLSSLLASIAALTTQTHNEQANINELEARIKALQKNQQKKTTPPSGAAAAKLAHENAVAKQRQAKAHGKVTAPPPVTHKKAG